MKTKNNELKTLANIAKKRLMSSNYVSETKDLSKNKKPSSYFLKSTINFKKCKCQSEYKIIENVIDQTFIDRVVGLLSSDLPFENIGKLCDYKYLSTLNKLEKEFYILNLTDKYNQVLLNYPKKVG